MHVTRFSIKYFYRTKYEKNFLCFGPAYFPDVRPNSSSETILLRVVPTASFTPSYNICNYCCCKFKVGHSWCLTQPRIFKLAKRVIFLVKYIVRVDLCNDFYVNGFGRGATCTEINIKIVRPLGETDRSPIQHLYSGAKKNNTRQIHKIIIEDGTLALMLHANPPFLAPNFRLSKDDF